MEPRALDHTTAPILPPLSLTADSRPLPPIGVMGKDQEELDTCRICRGDGSEHDPLFYPCRCRGTIRFVHQACLMDWLSHSKKHHCELCKTPFRFTKLYDPDMPRSLPVGVFLRKAFVHCLKKILLVCRIMLVVGVWLVWLPWSMRFIWRGLFWVVDAGWMQDPDLWADPLLADRIASGQHQITALGVLLWLPSTLFTISQFYSSTANPSTMAGRMDNDSQAINTNVGTMLYTGHAQLSSVFTNHESLLAEVPFLRNLTGSVALNSIVVDTLEGQIITSVIVAVLILVVLIREWVVQQQPMIDLGVLNLGRAPGQEYEPERAVDEAVELSTSEDALHAAASRPVNENDQGEESADVQNGENIEIIDSHETSTSTSNSCHMGATAQVSYVDATNNSLTADGHKISSTGTAGPKLVLSNTLSMTASRDLINPSLSGWGRADDIDGRFEEHDAEAHGSGISSMDGWQKTGPDIPACFPELLLTGTTMVQVRPRRSNSANQLDLTVKRDLRDSRTTDDPSDSSIFNTTRPRRTRSASAELAHHEAAQSHSATDQIFNVITTTPGTHQIEDIEGAYHPSEVDVITRAVQIDHNAATANLAASTSVTSHTSPVITQRTNDTGQNAIEDASEVATAPESLMDRIVDWMYGDLTIAPTLPAIPDGEGEQLVAEEIAHEEPPLLLRDSPTDVAGDQIVENVVAPNPEGGPGAAVEVGFNPNELEIVDDNEDIEGMMELIGLQGPLTGLLQSAVFSALLISATITSGVWFPYLWGKIVLMIIAHPYQIISDAVNLAIDVFLFLGSRVLYPFNMAFRLVLSQIWPLTLIETDVNSRIGIIAESVAHSGPPQTQSIIAYFLDAVISGSNYIVLSANLQAVSRMLPSKLIDSWKRSGMLCHTCNFSVLPLDRFLEKSSELASGFLVYLRSLEMYPASRPDKAFLEVDLPYRNTRHRAATIATGYACFILAGAMYLRRGRPFTTSRRSQKIENNILAILKTAGGVVKVILIIGIEMIFFPLYCGFLLADVALLPLFQESRRFHLASSMSSPWVSGFVHWFIGTCYMFHFALFVSMARKLLRRGVLYFIRDPDNDPAFHPVRDVLEKNVASQLRKIAFSALVYGALIIVCLGSVVWSLVFIGDSILPLRWTTNTTILNFPVDLLLYSFFMPLALRLLNPSGTLHILYEWWFRRCARALRLSHFLLGERHEDEESTGYWAGQMRIHGSGKYIWAPASDQVRVPKGRTVFLDAGPNDQRENGVDDQDNGAQGVQSSEDFIKVYSPPHFQLRIILFVLCVWTLTAVVGVSLTVLPLVLGRWTTGWLALDGVMVNDIYAYSVGLSGCGAAIYGASKYKIVRATLGRYSFVQRSKIVGLSGAWKGFVMPIASNLYTYVAFAVVLPSLFALLLELYLIMPLHTYLNGTINYTIYLVQDWTLGILCLRIAIRTLQSYPDSRLSRAARGVIVQGWLKPNVRLATRCFIAPLSIAMCAASLAPAAVGVVAGQVFFRDKSVEVRTQVQRYAYPALLALCIGAWVSYAMFMSVRRFGERCRDELFLIGERLHNFGEKRPPEYGTHSTTRVKLA